MKEQNMRQYLGTKTKVTTSLTALALLAAGCSSTSDSASSTPSGSEETKTVRLLPKNASLLSVLAMSTPYWH